MIKLVLSCDRCSTDFSRRLHPREDGGAETLKTLARSAGWAIVEGRAAYQRCPDCRRQRA